MDIEAISSVILNREFLFPFLFLTLVIWAILKMLFDYDNWAQSMVLAFIGIIFLPAIIASLSVGPAFFMLIMIGAILLSLNFRWNLPASIILLLIAFYAASVILPIF